MQPQPPQAPSAATLYALDFSRRFGLFITLLGAVIARRFREPQMAGLTVPLWNRVNRLGRRLQRLLARLAAGTLPPPSLRASRSEAKQSPAGSPPGREAKQSPAGSPPGREAKQSPAGSPPGREAKQSPAGSPPGREAKQSPAGSPPGSEAKQSPAGSPPGSEAKQSPAASPPASEAQQSRPVLPTGRGWLIRVLGHEAAACASQLEHLLAEAEAAELLARIPTAQRYLNPLRRLLGIAPFAIRQRPARPQPAPPAPPEPFEPLGEIVSRTPLYTLYLCPTPPAKRA